MKTLKSSLDGHIDKVATQWIEIKVSHIMNVYFQLVMFGMFVIVLFNHFLY